MGCTRLVHVDSFLPVMEEVIYISDERRKNLKQWLDALVREALMCKHNIELGRRMTREDCLDARHLRILGTTIADSLMLAIKEAERDV